MHTVKRLFKIVLLFKYQFYLSILCMLGLASTKGVFVYGFKPLFDGIEKNKQYPIEIYFYVGIAIILAICIKGIFYYGQSYLMYSLGQRMIKILRERLFKKIVSLPFSFFNKLQSGDLLSRFTTDLTYLDQAFYIGISGPARDFPTIFVYLAIMLLHSWQLFMVTFILIPITATLINRFGDENKKVTTKRQNKFGELSSLISETINGIRVVKAFNMEKYEIRRFQKENNKLYNYFLHTIRIGAYSTPYIELIGAICGAIIITYGGYLRKTDVISIGEFLSFLAAFFMLAEPLKKLNGFNLKVQEGIAATERIFHILDKKNPIFDNKTAKDIPPLKNSIRIDIDEFAYEEKVILKNIRLNLESGKIAAFVGSSGSGKTTLINLIPRFFNIPKGKGEIYIDGVGLNDIKLRSLRDQIAIVTQELILFNDTIANNISYGNINCPMNEIRQAAKLAHAHDFISQIEEGYDQIVGEKGVMLSGGQRQRICIARALIKNAPILILDEATSALDSESEKEVQSAIQNLMKNRTTLVIAHRLSTIQNADVIYVFKNGQIIEQGKHEELLSRKGEYHNLYELQFQDS